MRRLILSTAFAALAAPPALAQDAIFRTAGGPEDIALSELVDRPIYAVGASQEEGKAIGTVGDLILSRDGAVEALLVDIGSLSAPGARRIAVAMGAVQFEPDGSGGDMRYRLVINAARSRITGAPDYAPAGAASGIDATGGEAAAEVIEEAVERSVSQATPNIVERRTAAAARQPVLRDGYAPAAPGDLTADALAGASAYDRDDRRLGDVEGLSAGPDGRITHVILDVGGFLGIGEKPVQLDVRDLDILREASGSGLRVYVPMSREELEALPTHDG
ncbi:PRC-barrel domain-containing protein [Frigidibacter sp. SD6-1]|uniref:PRC-barrel domain-containing protein n=1 Tax=Frigidibacter sp. SD6-1 TaxID=3032581 RepID=UPI0024DF63C1|nr:PRC-barrel domain-containing protein [Frigidibacter sp. SD6-1]